MARRTRNPVQRRKDLVQRSLQLQRVLIAATVFLAPLVFWRATLDIFGIVKAAVVLIGALVVGAVALVRVFRSGRLELPRHPVMWALGAFLGLATIATFTSYAPMLSFVGHYSRFSGLLLYIAYAWLFIAAVRAFDDSNIDLLAGAVVAGAALVAFYGVLQELGIDPIPWGESVGVTSTLGNPNYVSSQMAFAIPIAMWAALDRRVSTGWRSAVAVGLILLVVTLPFAGSMQGYVASAVGSGVFALAWGLERTGAARKAVMGLLGVAASAGLAVFVAGLTGRGPLGFVGTENSFLMRFYDMRAAVSMALEFPLLGVGFDRYGGYYHALRAPAASQYQELDATTSVPHSVHLDMFASGGFPLGFAYLAFVVVIAWFLVKALRQTRGARRLMVGGIGGGWVAYQTASAISIDVPSLAATGWVLAAAVLVVSQGPEWVPWVLPWARAPEDVDDKKRGRRLKTKTRVTTRRVGKAATGAVVVLTVIGLWLVWVPVSADVHGKDAEVLQGPQTESAILAARAATEKVWWENKYPMQLGSIQAGSERYEEALQAFMEAAERDPRDLGAAVSTARIAEQLGEMDLAGEWFERALALEPHDPSMKSDVARYLMRQEEFARARELLESAVARSPDEAEYWLNLGYARQQTGDVEAAKDAYQQVLELRPDNEKAQEFLAQLDGEA